MNFLHVDHGLTGIYLLSFSTHELRFTSESPAGDRLKTGEGQWFFCAVKHFGTPSKKHHEVLKDVIGVQEQRST